MAGHAYDPTCNCDPCFAMWCAEVEVEKATAREEGGRRFQERMKLYGEILDHFEGRI